MQANIGCNYDTRVLQEIHDGGLPHVGVWKCDAMLSITNSTP